VGVVPTQRCQLILDGFLNKKNNKKCSQGLWCIPLHEHKQTDQKAILEEGMGAGVGVQAEEAP